MERAFWQGAVDHLYPIARNQQSCDLGRVPTRAKPSDETTTSADTLISIFEMP
jgi:hypothetical protein